jgi:hypothetical protein
MGTTSVSANRAMTSAFRRRAARQRYEACYLNQTDRTTEDKLDRQAFHIALLDNARLNKVRLVDA